MSTSKLQLSIFNGLGNISVTLKYYSEKYLIIQNFPCLLFFKNFKLNLNYAFIY